MRPGRLIPVVLLALAAGVPLADLLFAQPPARKPRKVAMLVGPSTYLHGFDPLRYCKNDVLALAQAQEESDEFMARLREKFGTK